MTKYRRIWLAGGALLACLIGFGALLYAKEAKSADPAAGPFVGEILLVELKGGKSVLLKKARLVKLAEAPFIVGEAEWHELGPTREPLSASRQWVALGEVVRLGEYKDFAAYDEAVRKAKSP
jgi:hypothetical protein